MRSDDAHLFLEHLKRNAGLDTRAPIGRRSQLRGRRQPPRSLYRSRCVRESPSIHRTGHQTTHPRGLDFGQIHGSAREPDQWTLRMAPRAGPGRRWLDCRQVRGLDHFASGALRSAPRYTTRPLSKQAHGRRIRHVLHAMCRQDPRQGRTLCRLEPTQCAAVVGLIQTTRQFVQ